MSGGKSGSGGCFDVLVAPPSLLFLLAGCGDLRPLPISLERCPAWTAPDASAACKERGWVLPGAEDGLGPAGARSVSAAIDGRGQAILGWEVNAPGLSGIAVAEEHAAGAFALRSPTIHVVTDTVIANASQTRVAAGANGEAVVTWS
ncbi:MAG: hypothetical protein ABI134_29145, partial [Byssovorax sp.]